VATSISDNLRGNPAELQGSGLAGSENSRRLTDEQRQWLADLYQANFASVFRLCEGVLRSREDAADAAHETFLVAMDSIQPGATPKMARSWLLTVARNHCLDVLRRRKRYGRALVTLGGNPTNGTDMESAIAERDFVSLVLSRLSLRERQALWQSAVESRPVADIAMGLRLNYMAAAQVLHRARLRAEAAARIAVVIGIARLGRSLRRAMFQRNLAAHNPSGFGSLLSVDRLLALAAVPIIVVASQSSSSPARPPGADSSTVAAPANTIGLPAPTPVGSKSLLSQGSLGPLNGGPNGQLPASGTVPAGVSSALDGLIGTVSHAIGQLTGPAPTASASGTLPGTSTTIPQLPVPTPSPSLAP
jgi:RNA polymerase sigma-70 factor, ECF subfamily